MFSKWATVIFAFFMIYSILLSPGKFINPLKHEELSPKTKEITEKIKQQIKTLTEDNDNRIVANKENPLIKEESTSNLNENSFDSFTYSNPSTLPKQNSMHNVQNKILNFVYKALHTKQGQDLLEKLLTNPRATHEEEKPTFNPYNNNSVVSILEGEGSEIKCGDKVTAHFTTRLVNGQVIENTRLNNKPRTFQVGNNDVIQGIEFATIGMKKGGQRRLITLPKYAYTKEEFSKNLVGNNEFITIDIEVLNANYAIDKIASSVKVLQDKKEKDGIYLLCGERVYFHYKLYDSNEKIIAQSNLKQPANIIIGSNQVPPSMNLGFDLITSRSKRLIMFPASSIYNQIINFLPKNANIPPKGILMLEIDTNVKK